MRHACTGSTDDWCLGHVWNETSSFVPATRNHAVGFVERNGSDVMNESTMPLDCGHYAIAIADWVDLKS